MLLNKRGSEDQWKYWTTDLPHSLLAFSPDLFCSQWLQPAAHNSTWTWSSAALASKAAPGNECGWDSHRLVFLALHQSSTTVGLCVFVCAFVCPKAGTHTLGFMLYKHCSNGLQHNPHFILVSLNRIFSPLVKKYNNCITGQRGKRRPKDKSRIEDVAVLSGWDSPHQ